ncbi:hypothetical protein [Arcicella rosea]|uniref:Uncharacterized protein n=1 Tax=Arcicella rosea TaxID=502909 RepID=A0A841EQ52_9BACT|nr:hypothetical protein [Arcicella rosea]MBB6004384.1 hypothetical protein [Arcicella rosea]
MKTVHELNDEILKITMLIQEKFPELSKYVTEMPVSIPDVENPEVNQKNLQEYYESLLALMKKYNTNHNRGNIE